MEKVIIYSYTGSVFVLAQMFILGLPSRTIHCELLKDNSLEIIKGKLRQD